MIYLFCGIIIGSVMGLTGAGGALVAIPLFIQFLGMDLKEASVYSLLAVVVASILNYVSQSKATQYRTGFLIVVASALGSFVTAPFKENLPTVYVAIILASVSLYALYSVWKPVRNSSQDHATPKNNLYLSLSVGLALGALTTFTGLGGGVLMLPLFLTFFHYSQSQAVATSLFAVGLSSLASLMVQVSRGTRFEVGIDLFFLVLGILISVLILKQFLKGLSEQVVSRTRQVIFTIVVILALVKIF
jgi:uncharacterized membrane protein YfcA